MRPRPTRATSRTCPDSWLQSRSIWAASKAALHCRPDLAARLEPLLNDRPWFALVPDDKVPAGFVARAGDGSCTIDCTLATRLRALRPRLEAKLLAQVPR